MHLHPAGRLPAHQCHNSSDLRIELGSRTRASAGECHQCFDASSSSSECACEGGYLCHKHCNVPAVLLHRACVTLWMCYTVDVIRCACTVDVCYSMDVLRCTTLWMCYAVLNCGCVLRCGCAMMCLHPSISTIQTCAHARLPPLYTSLLAVDLYRCPPCRHMRPLVQHALAHAFHAFSAVPPQPPPQPYLPH